MLSNLYNLPTHDTTGVKEHVDRFYRRSIKKYSKTEGLKLGLVSTIVPAIIRGNTIITFVLGSNPLSSIFFGEVLNSSDVPKGVINILTGEKEELVEPMTSHMDVNSIIFCDKDENMIKTNNELASNNLKRTIFTKKNDWIDELFQSFYFIEKNLELKTACHPTDV